MVEISAIRVVGGEPVSEFSMLGNPEMPIPYDASDLNGITDEMVENSPVFRETLGAFLTSAVSSFGGNGFLVFPLFHIAFSAGFRLNVPPETTKKQQKFR